jgi:hypothetical protein
LAASSNSSGPRRPLKGSWEATLEEAHALARRDDERTVAHYWRLIDRLASFPPERRLASPGKLQLYLEEALFAAQAYLSKRGRFNEAQAFFSDRVEELLDADTLSDWNLNRAKLLLWDGQRDLGQELLLAELNDVPLSIPARWLLFDTFLEEKRFDETASLIDDLDSTLRIYEDAAGDLALHHAFVYYLRSALALAQAEWETAFDFFQKAAHSSDAYADNWHMLYRPLIFQRQIDLANRALNREPSEASQRFWRGLNGFYNGDKVGAKVEWTQATALDISTVWVRSAADWILAHYYLGDEKRLGLELALRLLNRPQHEHEPLMLLLAALGWSLREDWNNVRINLDFALARYRENLQGVRLPEFYRHIAQDLMGEAHFPQFAHYFDQ